MNEITPADVIIGVDTHKDVHAVVAINGLGVHLATTPIPANSNGYHALERWATALGPVRAVGIEGTGSDDAGLSRFLSERDHPVLEVSRISRQLRQKGKIDTVDAENAARAVLGGQATAQPKSGTRARERYHHRSNTAAHSMGRWWLLRQSGRAERSYACFGCGLLTSDEVPRIVISRG